MFPEAFIWERGIAIFSGKTSATPNVPNGVEVRELTNASRAEDVRRRLKEAENFIKEHQGTNRPLGNETNPIPPMKRTLRNQGQ